MLSSSDNNYSRSLVESTAISFHIISHRVLGLFYLFCALVVFISYFTPGAVLTQYTTILLILFYTMIVLSLIMGSQGILEMHRHAIKLSLVGLSLAIIHQIYLLFFLNFVARPISILFDIVLVIEIFLVFNMFFNRKMRLLKRYITKINH